MSTSETIPPGPGTPACVVGAMTERDVAGVLALQRRYLRGARPPGEEARDGFLTLQHDAPTLERMAASAPQVVAHAGAPGREGGEHVVAYALTLVPTLRGSFPLLAPMFALLDGLDWRGAPLAAQPYYVMGQVCVDAGYRGVGLFDRLYAAHRALLGERFSLCVTEVAARNARSLAAHARVGFEVAGAHDDALTGEAWRVLVWDWRGDPASGGPGE